MRIIDGSGTHTFINRISSDIDAYNLETREVRYKSISQVTTQSTIGTDYITTFDFQGMTLAEKNELNAIHASKSITLIDNLDEVLSSEGYTEYTAPTLGFFIENKSFKSKQSIKSKDIKFYNARLIIRFDVVTDKIKP